MSKQIGPTLMFGGRRRLWVRLRLLWEPRDLWIGVYHRRVYTAPIYRAHDIYTCLLPCLPIMASVWWLRGPAKDAPA